MALASSIMARKMVELAKLLQLSPEQRYDEIVGIKRNGFYYEKNGLTYIDKTKITKEDYIKLQKEESGLDCEKCAGVQYDLNTGWAQFCEEHAPTMYMDCTPEEYERKYGISLAEIKRDQVNIKIVHK